MLFSTYYKDKNLLPWLPGEGCRVTLSDPRYRAPLVITERTRDKHGTVFFSTISGELQSERCEWWPDAGDIVSISAGHYCEWMARTNGYSRFRALSEMADPWFGDLTLLQTKKNEGKVAVINPPTNVDSRDLQPIWVPLTMLRVPTKQGVRLKDLKKANLPGEPEKAKPTAEQLKISDDTKQAVLDKFGLKL
jgi:hypothetical protein